MKVSPRFALTASFVGLYLLSGCSSSGDQAGGNSCVPESGSHMLPRVVSAAQSGLRLETAGAGLRRLQGHVLEASAAAKDQGSLASEQDMPVSVSLPLNDEVGLQRELAEIYDPTSPKFRHFLNAGDFSRKYGPTAEQRAQVVNYLQANGLHSIESDEGSMMIHAVGSPRALNAAFGTEVHQYLDAKGRSFRAPNREPAVPAGLAIQGVHGLQDLIHAHTHLRSMASAPARSDGSSEGEATDQDSAVATPEQDASGGAKAGTGPNGGFSPADIRSAYNLPANLDASGETIAMFELDGYTASDITGYEQKFGLPNTPLQNVLVNGSTGSAGGGAAEVTLDIELALALAPNAAKILVYEGPNNEQGILATYAKIASDNLAKSVSTSWGSSEEQVSSSFVQAENTIFMQMALQGQTIYSAAGDEGAKDNGSSLSVDDPSSQPYVSGVGGTRLSTTSSSARQGETTWNDASGGGGGGISKIWTIPSWQAGLANDGNKVSSTMRNIPDVSLNSDIETGYSIYYHGAWSVWGGTSAAAPLWAGFNALVNHARAERGLGALGYANPLFAQIGRSNSYSHDFFDIADNSNNGYFPATAGFDNATGWGSFNAANLLADLSDPGAGVIARGDTSLGASCLPGT